MNKSNALLLSTSIGTFGASLFWTGFPVFLSSLYKHEITLSGIYSYATFGTLLFTLFGGIWCDRGNYKILSLYSNLLSMFFMGLVAIFIYIGEYNFLLYSLPILYFNFSLGHISETVWLLKMSEGSTLENRVLDRSMFSLVSKLAGFSLGPIIFTRTGHLGTILCAITFLGAASVQMMLFRQDKSVNLRSDSEITDKWFTSLKAIFKFNSSNFLCMLLATLTGLLSLPLNPLVVSRLEKFGTSEDISAFWLIAGLCGFTATVFMRKFELIQKKWIFYILTLLSCILITNIFKTENAKLIIFFASLYVFSSIFFTVKSQILLTQKTKHSKLGSTTGLFHFYMDLGIFAGMLLGTKLNDSSLYMFTTCVCVFALIRLFALINYQNRI